MNCDAGRKIPMMTVEAGKDDVNVEAVEGLAWCNGIASNKNGLVLGMVKSIYRIEERDDIFFFISMEFVQILSFDLFFTITSTESVFHCLSRWQPFSCFTNLLVFFSPLLSYLPLVSCLFHLVPFFHYDHFFSCSYRYFCFFTTYFSSL